MKKLILILSLTAIYAYSSTAESDARYFGAFLEALHQLNIYPSVETLNPVAVKSTSTSGWGKADKIILLQSARTVFGLETVKLDEGRFALVEPLMLSSTENPMNFVVKSIELKDMTLDDAVSFLAKTYNLKLRSRAAFAREEDVYKVSINLKNATIRQIIDNFAMQAHYKNWKASLYRRNSENIIGVTIFWESR